MHISPGTRRVFAVNKLKLKLNGNRYQKVLFGTTYKLTTHNTSTMSSTTSTGAGLVILHPEGHSVLLIRDDRHNKWSFPKGRKEDFDTDLLATAIRETYEETGFQKDVHYTLATSKKKERSYGNTHVIFAQALTTELPFTSCPEHHVAEVAWIPITTIRTLDTNQSVRLAFGLKRSRKD